MRKWGGGLTGLKALMRYFLIFAALAAAFVAPAKAGKRSLAPWHGEYTDGSTVTLTIASPGNFDMRLPCQTSGDALTMVTLKGDVRIGGDGWLHLTAKQKEFECKVPERFDYFGVRHGASRVLVTQGDLIMMVNSLNGFGNFNGGLTALRDVASAKTVPPVPAPSFNARAFMPPSYLAMLRTEPLTAVVTRVDRTGSEIINAAGWMQPPEMKERFHARVTVNRGSRHGVFVGMLLYSPQAELRIDHVRDEESEASYRWIPPGQVIEAGAPLSSRR